MFSEDIAHHMEKWRKEKCDADKQNKQLANKLTQLQFGELSKQTKEKEKAKTQALVNTAAQAQALHAVEMVPQSPAEPQIQSEIQTSSGRGQNTPVTPSISLPPIHVHVNQTGVDYRPGMKTMNDCKTFIAATRLVSSLEHFSRQIVHQDINENV